MHSFGKAFRNGPEGGRDTFGSQGFRDLFLNYMCVVGAGTGNLHRASEPLELEVQGLGTHWIWVLGTELKSPARAVHPP